MGITIDPTQMSRRGHLHDATTKQRLFVITLDNSYPSGGYDCDLEKYTSWRVDDNLSSSFGGWQGEYDTINKKLIVHRSGIEADVGTSFYDAVKQQYGKLLIWAFQLDNYYDEKGKQPSQIMSGDPPADNRMLRKDQNDSIQAGVTTTVPATSTLKVEGEQVIEVSASQEVKGELKIASGGVAKVQSGGTHEVESGGTQNIASGATQEISGTSTVKSGAVQAIEAGAKQEIAGEVVAVSAGSLPASTTPSVNGAQYWTLDGSITPIVDFFNDGVEGKLLTINCISQATIKYDPSKINLSAKEDLVMLPSDYLDLMLVSGVWEQKGGVRGYGSHTVASGGTFKSTGSMIQIFCGTISSAMPDISSGQAWQVDGGITPTISNFVGGEEGKTILIYCKTGPVTITHSANVDLTADVDFVMKTGDNLILKYTDGVWKEPVGRVVKDGSSTVADGGIATIKPGGTVSNEGVVINKPVVAPASSTLDATNNSYFYVDGTVTPTISGISGGSEGKIVGIGVTAGTVTFVHSASLVLQKSQNMTLNAGDGISFQMKNGVWEIFGEPYRKNGAILGNYQTFNWSASVSLAPSTSDIYKTTVTSDGTITLSGGAGGLTIIILLENDAVANHTVTFAGVTTSYASSIVLKPSQIASVKFYHDGVSWTERQPEFF